MRENKTGMFEQERISEQKDETQRITQIHEGKQKIKQRRNGKQQAMINPPIMRT